MSRWNPCRLTPLQRALWRAITDDPRATVRELAERGDCAESSVLRGLERLEAFGAIRRERVQNARGVALHSPRATLVLIPFSWIDVSALQDGSANNAPGRAPGRTKQH